MVNIKKLNKAVSFVNNNDFESAEKVYSELLREYPNDETVLSFWGMFNLKRGFLTRAEKILQSAYNVKKAPSTIAALAYTKYRLKKYDDAIIFYEELFRFDKDSEQIYIKIIESFRALYMYDFANAYCKKYLAAYPDNKHALTFMTLNYFEMADYKNAEELCAKCMELYPDNSATWISAGLIQETLYCNEEYAQECYKRALELNDVQALYHLAVSLHKTGNDDEAEMYYQKSLEIMPNDLDAKASMGTMYLSQRKFNKGYEYFMQRERSLEMRSLKNLWTGNERKYGGTILVYSDQGLGDNIMFARYLPFLKDKFSRLIVYVKKSLLSIFIKSYPDIEFVSEGLSDLEYDKSILMSDVPYFLDMDFSEIPFEYGYLTVDEERMEYFKNKYFNTDKLKIGLCWKAGSFGARGFICRTVNIDYFKPLLENKNVEFYSFQLDDIFDGCKKYPQIIDLSDDLKDFDDTAAALKNLDLFVCVDTSCIHMAGSIGVKSILMLPYCPDWRWFDNNKTTEWYSSIEIVKQEERQDWFKEVDRIVKIVNNL